MPKYQGRTAKLNKPFVLQTKEKSLQICKRSLNGNVKKVRFGDPNMKIKKSNPTRQRSFLARHGAILKKVRGQKTLAPVYWAMKSWRKGFNV